MTTPKELDAAFKALVGFACQWMPAGWTMEVGICGDEASTTLIDPDGEIVDLVTDDMTDGEIFAQYVCYACAKAGVVPPFSIVING